MCVSVWVNVRVKELNSSLVTLYLKPSHCSIHPSIYLQVSTLALCMSQSSCVCSEGLCVQESGGRTDESREADNCPTFTVMQSRSDKTKSSLIKDVIGPGLVIFGLKPSLLWQILGDLML